MIKAGLYILLSLLGSVLSLVFEEHFNFFDFFNLLDESKSFDYCISVYFTLIQCGVAFFYDRLTIWVKGLFSNVEVIAFVDKEEMDLEKDLVIKLNSCDTGFFQVRVKISGNYYFLKNKTLCLRHMYGLDYQIEPNDESAVSCSDDDEILVDLFKLCGGQKKGTGFAVDIEVGVQCIVNDAGVIMMLEPEILGKFYNKLGINYKRNKIKIKRGE